MWYTVFRLRISCDVIGAGAVVAKVATFGLHYESLHVELVDNVRQRGIASLSV